MNAKYSLQAELEIYTAIVGYVGSSLVHEGAKRLLHDLLNSENLALKNGILGSALSVFAGQSDRLDMFCVAHGSACEKILEKYFTPPAG